MDKRIIGYHLEFYFKTEEIEIKSYTLPLEQSKEVKTQIEKTTQLINQLISLFDFEKKELYFKVISDTNESEKPIFRLAGALKFDIPPDIGLMAHAEIILMRFCQKHKYWENGVVCNVQFLP